MYRAKQRFHFPGDDDDDDDETMFDIGEIKKDDDSFSPMSGGKKSKRHPDFIPPPRPQPGEDTGKTTSIAFADRRRWGGPQSITDPETTELGDLKTNNSKALSEAERALLQACAQPSIKKDDGMHWQKITEVKKEKQRKLLVKHLQDDDGSPASSPKESKRKPRQQEEEEEFLPHQAVYGDEGKVGSSGTKQRVSSIEGGDELTLQTLAKKAKEKVKGAYDTLNEIYDTNGEAREREVKLSAKETKSNVKSLSAREQKQRFIYTHPQEDDDEASADKEETPPEQS